MYIRADHAETAIPALRAFIKANPLGIFTTALKSDAHPFIQCSHIPFVLDVDDELSESELGKLRGHMARANPQAKAIADAAKTQAEATGAPLGAPVTLEDEVLVLFNAPVHHYVTAKSYVETKPSSGKVVPTWNYAAVQAYGRLTVYYDTKSEATARFLQSQITDLSHMAETEIMGFEKPWKVTDAPTNYIGVMAKAIVGIEIEITRLAGKWKMSQEAKPGDRAGIAAGFKRLGTETGDWMAKAVEERGAIAEAAKKN